MKRMLIHNLKFHQLRILLLVGGGLLFVLRPRLSGWGWLKRGRASWNEMQITGVWLNFSWSHLRRPSSGGGSWSATLNSLGHLLTPSHSSLASPEGIRRLWEWSTMTLCRGRTGMES